ncbi:hypothetical protein [Micromonospora sp. WMMD737]|uniref:hypothetical protein n=1 Tax=Micromonospora sp. WMMD737 TaxID=3404113 RepID=UPI003B938139
MSCWRGRDARRLAAEARAAEVALDDDVDDVDEGCAACGEPEPSPTCWLCGYSWLAAAREAFERDQVAEAAAVEQQFALLAERTDAESRVAELAAWVERLRTTVESYAAGGGRGRAVELLADLLTRDAAARVSRRGRPSMLARVAGVLAVDADYRSGRRALPGRARSAELAGCTERAVTAAWARCEALGWAERTRQGGKLSLAERTELGRYNDRAEFDLAPVHRGEAAVRASYVPLALLVLDELMQHALGELAAAQDDVDALVARTASVVDHAALARRVQLRLAASTARDTLLADVEAIATAQIETGNSFPPRLASQGEYLSSCLSRGFAQPLSIAPAGSVEPSRGEKRASRSSSTSEGRRASRSVRRPRPIERACAPSRRSRPAPEWIGWAYDLARAAQRAFEWLEPAPLPRVAALLGSRLGPRWTMPDLLDWIRQSRDGRELLDAPKRPLGYLRSLLDESLTGNVEPPHQARRYDQHRAQVAADHRREVAEQAAVSAAAMATHRAGWNERDTVAQAERAGPGAGRHAAIAVARAAARGDHAAARAIAAAPESDWPETAQPGCGLPVGRNH